MNLKDLKENHDFIHREVKKGNLKITLFYLKSLCDEKKITCNVISPFYDTDGIHEYEQYIRSFEEWSTIKEEKDAVEKIFSGSIIILQNNKMYSVKLDNFESRPVSESTEESVLQGPKDSLNEKISISLNIIRNRYRKETLRVKNHTLGQISKTNIILLYDEKLCDKKVLQHLNNNHTKSYCILYVRNAIQLGCIEFR